MWLIATDEAGYGPKLGPLVIVATTWKIPDKKCKIKDGEDSNRFDSVFEAFRQPVKLGDCTVRVDDSKAIFQSNSSIKKGPVSTTGIAKNLSSLHSIASAAVNGCGLGATNLDQWLSLIANNDLSDLVDQPWLKLLGSAPFLTANELKPLTQQWGQASATLVSVTARVITAKRFNQTCQAGFNKADLLSESTLGLVADAVKEISSSEKKKKEDRLIEVFCDRHGGRRYYAGVIQHVLDAAKIQSVDGSTIACQVMNEAKQKSSYRVLTQSGSLQIHFTVKGDRFTPVAFSSLIAKYLRERLMSSLNEYFISRHDSNEDLKPTAGYPLDADRFLSQIDNTIQRERIDIESLVRQR